MRPTSAKSKGENGREVQRSHGNLDKREGAPNKAAGFGIWKAIISPICIEFSSVPLSWCGKLHISGLMEMLELQLHGEDGSFGLQDHESSSNMNIEIGSRFDPMCLQLTRTAEYTAAQLGAFNDPTADGNCLGNCSVVAEILQPEFRAAAAGSIAELAWP
ncbi:hypothetical protein KIW84_013760 [Lathyrus oleraceus]|uniref:Uncharacterized protein n=1 Tax=Pisum sativum TaxID=3888 RepID=A0A9D5BL19_PEA|nr:hypothetical protein KIW84_013760 [Pisum sativum]